MDAPAEAPRHDDTVARIASEAPRISDATRVRLALLLKPAVATR